MVPISRLYINFQFLIGSFVAICFIQFSYLCLQAFVDVVEPLLSFQGLLVVLFSTLGVDLLAIGLPLCFVFVLALLATD